MPEQINYNYLGLTVVLIAITYFLVAHNKVKESAVHLDQTDRGFVKVYTAKGIERIDPDLLIMHLGKIKHILGNAVYSVAITDDKYDVLMKYVDDAKKQLMSYIDINSNDETSRQIEENKNKRDALKAAQKNKETILSDRDDSASIELNESVDDLINYIEIVESMIKSSMCKEDVLNVNILHETTMKFKKAASSILTNIKPVHVGSGDTYENMRVAHVLETELESSTGGDVSNSRRIDVSQNMVDKTSIVRKRSMGKQPPVSMHTLSSASHYIEDAFSPNVPLSSAVVKTPTKKSLYETHAEHLKSKKILVDKYSRNSLLQNSR